MKIRTLNELQDTLDRDFSWRLKEIANLQLAISTQTSAWQSTLIRAGVTLLYAHWEGFVKNAAESYILFVSTKRLKHEELASNFVVFGAKKHLHDLANSQKAALNIEAVEFFLTKMSQRANISLSSAVNTESNLGSAVFENIVISVGIDPRPYQTKHHFIDSSLLNRRNRIAHGEYLDLEANSYKLLSDEVIVLMRRVKTDIENLAAQGAYRRS